jgi:hypothetical protein
MSAPHTKDGLKKCGKCKKLKPLEEYGRRTSNSAGRRQHCRVCYKPHPSHGYEYPHWHDCPNPCKQCGKTYRLNRPPCMLKIRQYCSEDCRAKACTKPTRMCTRCELELPYTDFGFTKMGSHPMRMCKKCLAEKERSGGNPVGYRCRSTPYAMHKALHVQASKAGRTSDLTRGMARKMYEGDCCLCGRPVTALRSRDQYDFNAANLRGFCRRCVRIEGIIGHDEMLLLAHEIAIRNPLEKPS